MDAAGKFVTAFVPTADVRNAVLFELKMLLGVIVPSALGWWLYRPARSAPRQVQP